MSDLAERKRLLLAQGELQRQVARLEYVQLQARWQATRNFVHRKRWWLAAGALAGGVLLRRKAGGLLGLVPTVLALGKALRR